MKKQRSDGTPTLRDAVKKFNYKLALRLSALIILAVAVFRLLKLYDLYLFAIILYTAVMLGVTVYYIVYNRGVLSGSITPEMLPTEWSDEQKNAMIEDMSARRRKSRWVQLVLIPLIFTYAFELLELYFFPLVRSLFSGG